MKQKLLSGRPVVTRTSRHDPRGAKLESVAAEFALLAQRRARIARQVDLLARQLDAATTGLDGVQSRMSLLAQRLHQIDPDLANGLHVQVPLPPLPLVSGNMFRPQAKTPDPPVTRNAAPVRPMRHLPRRRPFLPE
jgi:hypothetical protein